MESVSKNKKFKHIQTGKIAEEVESEKCCYLVGERRIPKFIIDGNTDWELLQ
jgi:hypothetical protein